MGDGRGLRDAVNDWLAALEPEQRQLAVRAVDDEAERRTWYYWPAHRGGLSLREMHPDQQILAHHVVAEAVSAQTFAKVQAIIALEHVLDEIEGRTGSQRGLARDPSLYSLTIFGKPTADALWGMRFEGHHVSLHLSTVRDEFAFTPCFLGANPAAVRHGERTVTRPLAEEEDVGRELVHSLDEAQLVQAMVGPDAPDDILTTNLPTIDELPAGGLHASDLGAEQRVLLEELIRIHTDRARPGTAGRELDRIREAGLENLSFAWAGSVEPGERHYYRVSGATLLIEYDNTQDDANHVHSVWRDVERDFGADLLRVHIDRDHH